MRDPALDAMRSCALWGIIVANMPFFAMPGGYGLSWWAQEATQADILATFFIRTFVEGKFVGLFSMLFGFGIAQQLARHGHGYGYRRMMALAGLGVIHGAFLFGGDILLAYALCGTGFIVLRNRMTHMVHAVIAGLCLSVMGMAILSALDLILAFPKFDTSVILNTLQNGGLAEYVTLNLMGWIGFYSEMPFHLFWYIAACCALGSWFHARFDNIGSAAAAIQPYTALFWSMGIAGNLLYGTLMVYGQVHDIPMLGYIAAILRPIFGFIFMLGLFNGLYHLMQRGAQTWVVQVLAKTGRASLSLYVGQSCVGVGLIWGAGLYAQLGMAQVLGLSVLAGLALQLCLLAWLTIIPIGPLEYLMRKVSKQTKVAISYSQP
ncbi:MAG: DUF418 domain-containing protein [Aliishimia sp.]